MAGKIDWGKTLGTGTSGASSSGKIDWAASLKTAAQTQEDIDVTEARDMAGSRTRGLGLPELNTQVQTGKSTRTVPFPAMPRPTESPTLAMPKPITNPGAPVSAQNSIARRPQSATEIKAYTPVTPDAIKQRTKELQDQFNTQMRELDIAYKTMASQPQPTALRGKDAQGGFNGTGLKDLADIQRKKLDLQMSAKATVGEAEAKRQLLEEQAKARILLDPTNNDAWLQHAANGMSWQEANNFQLDPEYQKLAKAATYSTWKQQDAQQRQDDLNRDQRTAGKVIQTALSAAGKTFTSSTKSAIQFMAGMGANTQELLTTITGIDFLGAAKSREQNWAESSATQDQLAADREKMVGTDKTLGFVWDAAGAIPDAVMLMGLAIVSGGGAEALPIIGKFLPQAKEVYAAGKVFASPLIKEGLVPLMKRTLTFAPEMIPMFAKITSQAYAANIKSGMSEPQAFIAAILDAYGQSLLEGGGMNAAFKEGGVKGLLQWAKTWAEEGSEEITQNWWENAINALVSGKTVPVVSLDANQNSIINVPQDLRAGAIGAVVAGAMGAGGAVFTGAIKGGVAAGQAVGKGVEAVQAKFNPTVVSQPDLFEEAQKSSKYAKDMVNHIQKSEQYQTAKKAYDAEVARVGAENTAAQQAYDAEAAKVNAANDVITKGAQAGQAEVDKQNQTARKGYEAIVRKGLDITNKESVSRGVNANLAELTAQVRKEQEARSANAYVAVDAAENSFDERDKTPEQIQAWKNSLAPVYNELMSAEAALDRPVNRADIRNILLKGRASADLIRIASKGLIPAPAPIAGQSTAQPIPMPVAPVAQRMPTAPAKPGSAPVAPVPGEAIVDTSKMIPAIAAKLEATYASVTPAQKAEVLALARQGVDRSGSVSKTGLSPAQVRAVLSMNGVPDVKSRSGQMWVRQQAYIDSVKTQASTAVEDRKAFGAEVKPTIEAQQAKLDKTNRKGLVVAEDLTIGHQFVQSLARTLGRDVVYYNGGKNAANAFYSTGAKDTLFINIDAATDAQATTVYMGHEFLHSIQQTDSKLYKELKKAFGSTLTSEQATKALAKYEAYPEEHAKLSKDMDALIDEMMGEEAGTLFISKDFWDAVSKQDENLAQKLARHLRTFLNHVLDAIVGSPNSDVVSQLQLKEFQKKFEAAVGDIIRTSDAKAKAALDEAGMASTEDTVAPPVEQFANRTFTRDMESNDLYNALIAKGIEDTAAKKWLKDMTSVARTIRKNAGTLDFQGSDLYKALKKNADPQYKFSLDFSTLCVKRYVLQATLEAAQVRLGRGLSIYEWLEIRSQLKNTYKQVVSCGLCYVESKRMFMGNAINDFYDNYVEKKTWFTRAKREGKPIKGGGRDASTIMPYTENIPPKSLFMTQEGIDTLKRDYPEIYTDFNNLLSSNVKVKLQESRVEYDRDIAKHYKNEDTVATQNMNSGQRIQSWSDFEAVHLLDLMQAVVDMQLVGLKAHAYTKVLDFVRSMAKTGIMINMSLIPKNMGFNEDGTLAWDNVEGIDFDKALPYAKKFDNTVGFIGVGISPAHIRAMLKDPNIHYIIPYHISGNSKLNRSFSKEATVNWIDFTPYQNESSIKDIQEEYDPDVVGSKFKFYDWWVDGDSAAVNVERYFALCKANGLNPRFSGYTNKGVYDPEFDFRKDPNYYKMLGDRRLFNNKGESITQQIVQPEFDNKVNQQILEDYIANPTPNAAHQQTVDKFLSDIDSGVDFAPSAEDIAELEKQWAKIKKAEAKAKKLAREAAAAPKVQYSMVPFKGSDKPIFYSQMERVIRDMKQNKWQASAVLPYLRANRGIKPEEIRWSGLEAWLSTFTTVTKDELLEFAQASDLGVQTIIKGEQYKEKQWSFNYDRYDTKAEAYAAYEKQKERLSNNGFSVQSTQPLEEGEEDEYNVQYQYEVLDSEDNILFGIRRVEDQGQVYWETSQHAKEYEDMAAVRADLPRLVKEINEGYLEELEPPELVTWDDEDTTKFKSYSYKDATNYREVLFRLPPTLTDSTYSGPHWDESNIFAHARLNDRVDREGNKVLFIEEIQSDLHQQGRKKGYVNAAVRDKLNADYRKFERAAELVLKKYNNLGRLDTIAAMARLEIYGVATVTSQYNITDPDDINALADFETVRESYQADFGGGGVPEAPFSKTWPMYVFKRILRMAAEGGYDRIAWSTSDQQFERWGSEKFVWKNNETVPKWELHRQGGSVQTFDTLELAQNAYNHFNRKYPNEIMRIESATAGQGWTIAGTEQIGGNAGGVNIEAQARASGHLLQTEGKKVTDKMGVRRLVEQVMSRSRSEYSPANWVKHIDSLTDKMWNRMQVEDEGNMMPRKEGMEGFYDRMLNKDVENYLKPFGTEVRLEGYPHMNDPNVYPKPAVHTIPYSFKGRYFPNGMNGGSDLITGQTQRWMVYNDVPSAYDAEGHLDSINIQMITYPTREDALEAMRAMQNNKFASWTVDLNPAINEMALSGEQTQYSVLLAKNLGIPQKEADLGAEALYDLTAKAKTPRAKTIAKDWTEKFLKEGMVSFRDVAVTGAEDIAVMAQVYRDPRFETGRFIFVGHNPRVGYKTVLHQTGSTSRMPGQALLAPGETSREQQDWFRYQCQLAAGAGATEYYILHNHPSGDPTPSAADRQATVNVYRWGVNNGMDYKGHIIINSNKYAYMGPHHLGTDRQVYGDITGEDKLLTSEKTHPELGFAVRSSESAKALAVSLKAPTGYSTLVYFSPGLKVRGIQEIPTSYAEDPKKLKSYLKKNALGFGGHSVILVAETDVAYNAGAEGIPSNFIFDAIGPNGESAREEGYLPGPSTVWQGAKLKGIEVKEQNSVRPNIHNWDTKRPPIDHGAAWAKTYSEVVDATFRITQADAEAGRLALNSKLVSGSVDYILKHKLVDINGNEIGNSLKSVTDKMSHDDWDYLAYRHNIDRYMEGKPVLPGVDEVASRQYVAAAEARDPGVKARADALVAWIDKFMQAWGVDSGLIDATTYADWRNMYPSYYPTYREFSDLEAGNTGSGAPGRRFIDLPSTVKRATGSDREITNPVGNVMQMVNKMVRSARYNEVGVALMNAVRANPLKLAKYAEEVPPRLGMFSRAANIVSVWDSGTPRYMQVNDEALLDTLNGLPKVINNAKIIRKVNRAFKSLITTDNPFFAIRNMFRDVPTAYVYGQQWNPITFGLNLLKADFNLIFNTGAARQYKALGGAGGGQFNTGILDIPTKGGTNAFAAAELAKTMKTNPVKFLNPLTYIKMFNEIIEQAPRLSEFDYVLRKTGDVQKALRAAQEVTVDFSRGGNISKSLDAFVPFFNASVQGIDTFNRKMLDVTHPAQMASRWIKGAIMVTTPAIVSILMCTANDRDRKAYETVSQFIKDSSYLFPKGDGTFWRIPKSRELGVLFASLFERLFTKAIVPGLEAKGLDASFLTTIFSNFLPVNPLAANLASPALINLPMNKTFSNATIVPTSLDKYSKGLQYDDNTSILSKAIGDATYRGGQSIGWEGLSPKQIDYIMDSYLGIIGDFALPALTPRSGAGSALKRMSIGAYSTDPAFSSQRVEDFYNQARKLEKLANDPNRLNNIPAATKTAEERTYNAYNALLTVASSTTKYINSSLKQDDPKIQEIRNTNNEWMAKAIKAKAAWELVQIKNQWKASLYQLGVRE